VAVRVGTWLEVINSIIFFHLDFKPSVWAKQPSSDFARDSPA